MKFLKLMCFLCVVSVSTSLVAQEEMLGPVPNPAPGVLDGVYVPEHIPTKKLIPWEHVREADAVWSKRVWRYIDMREKINHSMYYPLDKIEATTILDYEWVKHQRRWSLWTVILSNIIAGNLTVYSPDNPNYPTYKDGDSFKYPIVPPPGKSVTDSVWFSEDLAVYIGKLDDCEPVAIPNMWGEDSVVTMPDGSIETVYFPCDFTYFQSGDIVQYRLKEDWFFDKERSVMDVRIIGIAPVKYRKTKTGQIEGFEEIFWLYFPECRYVFQNYYVYNTHNDSRWFSYDDLFWKRQFNSVIYKSSNVYDRKIESYRVGVDALLESEKITNEIRMIEHDVWSL